MKDVEELMRQLEALQAEVESLKKAKAEDDDEEDDDESEGDPDEDTDDESEDKDGEADPDDEDDEEDEDEDTDKSVTYVEADGDMLAKAIREEVIAAVKDALQPVLRAQREVSKALAAHEDRLEAALTSVDAVAKSIMDGGGLSGRTDDDTANHEAAPTGKRGTAAVSAGAEGEPLEKGVVQDGPESAALTGAELATIDKLMPEALAYMSKGLGGSIPVFTDSDLLTGAVSRETYGSFVRAIEEVRSQQAAG